MAAKTNTAAAKSEAAQDAAEVESKPVAAKTTQKPKPLKAVAVDIHQFIPVRNGFQGALIYVSKRTGEEFVWDNFGDEQEMELQELKNAKSSNKGFFERNWFMFDDEYQWVIDYLGIGAFYKNALKLEEFDEVFEKSPEEIMEIVPGLSDGQKASLIYRARQLISEGGIDSNKAIAALEESLGTKLVEK